MYMRGWPSWASEANFNGYIQLWVSWFEAVGGFTVLVETSCLYIDMYMHIRKGTFEASDTKTILGVWDHDISNY